MLRYLTHKLKSQSINEENPNEKVSFLEVRLYNFVKKYRAAKSLSGA